MVEDWQLEMFWFALLERHYTNKHSVGTMHRNILQITSTVLRDLAMHCGEEFEWFAATPKLFLLSMSRYVHPCTCAKLGVKGFPVFFFFQRTRRTTVDFQLLAAREASNVKRIRINVVVATCAQNSAGYNI